MSVVDQKQADVALLEQIRSDYFISNLGLSGVSYESTGAHVFDEAASMRVHARYHSHEHRRKLAKWERVRYALDRMTYHDRRVIELVLSPSSSGFGGDEIVRRNMSIGYGSNISLAPLAAESRTIMRTAIRAAEREPDMGWETTDGAYRMLMSRVYSGERKTIKRVRTECEKALWRAAAVLRSLLREYDNALMLAAREVDSCRLDQAMRW